MKPGNKNDKEKRKKMRDGGVKSEATALLEKKIADLDKKIKQINSELKDLGIELISALVGVMVKPGAFKTGVTTVEGTQAG